MSLAVGGREPTPEDREAPEWIEIPGAENAFRLSPDLYSGGDPHGVESPAALKALGVSRPADSNG